VASLGAIFGATCLLGSARNLRWPDPLADLGSSVAASCSRLLRACAREGAVVVTSELTLERKDFDLTRDFAVA
jgi:hypothetical protein